MSNKLGNKLRNKFATFVAVSGAMTILPMLFFYVRVFTVELVLPTSHYFTYYSVAPFQEEYKVGEPIAFISGSEVARKVNFSFEDVLYCDTYDGFGFAYYSNYSSVGVAVPPRERKQTKWFYNAGAPEEAATCYLKSVISHVDDTGVKKIQVINDSENTFKIVLD